MPSSISPTFWAVSGAVLLWGLYRLLRIGRRDNRLPPGPPTLPLIGNMHQFPMTKFHEKLREWGDEYGKVYSLKLGSGTMIVLNDRRAVHHVLDKRSTTTSDRPNDYVTEMTLGHESFAFAPAKAIWRAQRKVASQSLSPRALDETVAATQDAEVGQLLFDLLETPGDFYNHVRRTTASATNIVTFGHRGPTFESFWAHTVYDVLEMVSACLEVGASPPVEQFPFLKYIPERWAPWKRRAKNAFRAACRAWGESRARVERRRQQGDKRSSIADRLLDGSLKLECDLSDDDFNIFLGAFVQGGSDTSASAVLTNILMLAKHPRVQKRAQEELDRVCGADRPPVWSDFEKLPYINCIVKEGLRFRPILPAGFPHRSTQDEWYDGMLIPKGSTLVVPVWSLHFAFDEPETYNPDRYTSHPRPATDYAGSPDYENRDK